MANSSNEPPDDWYSRVQYASVSDIGMRRFNNQDAYAVVMAEDRDQWRQRGHLFLVADGMGAHAAGERASQLAAESVPQTYHGLTHIAAIEAIEESILEANLLIHTQGQARADRLGMGTTCSALVLLPAGAVMAHVGDSRVYRLRHDQLEQLTFDHSLVWEMMAANRMTEEQIPLSVPRNVITRSLGPNPKVEVDLEGPFPVQLGDLFLLCSDGLTGLVRDAEIGAILATLPVADAAQTLVDLAKLRGGNDNITIIVAQVGPRPERDATPPHAPPPKRVPGAIGAIAFAVLAVLCFLGAAAGLALRQWWSAALCTVGGLALASLAAMTSGPRRRHLATTKSPHAHLGRGPHRVTSCRPTRSLVMSIAESLGRLSAGSDVGAETVPRGDPHDACQLAEKALREGDSVTALVEYATTVRAIGCHLHRGPSPPSAPPDSSLP